VYRFEFDLGSFVDRGDRITFNPKHDWCEEWEVNEELISSAGEVGSWSIANQDTVILGCGDGGIIQVARTPNSTSGELPSSVWKADFRTTTMVRGAPPRVPPIVRRSVLSNGRRDGHFDRRV
jgi:hypothetical protein